MKIPLFQIVCVFIAVDSVKTKSTELRIPKTGPNNVNETYMIEQNVTRTPISAHHSTTVELNVKNRLMPKMQIKVTTTQNKKLSYVLTTRRPIMTNRKFTSKPHAVHYVYSQMHSEQSNFGKRRNLNAKRFKPQNKHNITLSVSKESENVEDRFKNFTDIGNIDESGQNKRKVNSNRRSNRRRGYSLATAASEPFKSVAFHSLANTTKIRSKSKLAIQDSLQKIRRIRPEMKGKTITTTDSVTTKIKQNTDYFRTNVTEKNSINTDTTSAKTIPLAKTTEKLVSSAKIAETLVNSSSTIKNLNDLVTVTENLIHTTTEIGKLHSSIKTEKPIHSVTTENFEDSENKTKMAASSQNTVEKLNNYEANTEIPHLSAVKTENKTTYAINTENPTHSATSSEKPSDIVIVKPVHSDNVIERLDKSDAGSEKSEPLIIVTPLTLSDTIATIEAYTNDNLEKKVDSNQFTIKKEDNIITMTPLSHGDEAPEETTQHLASRRKRRINIIEEERFATTSNGFRFSERGSPILDLDVTFKNIHT